MAARSRSQPHPATAAGIALLCVTFNACVFTPDNKYVNPIEPPKEIQVFVDIESPEFQDPFYLDDPTTFILHVDAAKPLRDQSVSIDGNQVTSGVLNNRIEFTIDPGGLTSGSHLITLQLTFKTLSGSMAERLGAEYYAVEESFEAIVDRSPISLTSPLAATMDDGYLTLSWAAGATRPLRYTLVKYLIQDGTTKFLETKNFRGEPIMSYIDSGYVGLPTRYELIRASSIASSLLGVTDATMRVANFSMQELPGKVFRLSWTTTLRNANVTLIGPGGTRTVAVTDLVLPVDTIAMGEQPKYRLLISRNLHQNQVFDSTFTLGVAPRLAPFKELRVLSSTDFVASTVSGLKKYDLATLAPKDSFITSVPFTLTQMMSSEDGQRLVFIQGTSAPTIVNPQNFSDSAPFRARLLQLYVNFDNTSYYAVGAVLATSLSSLSNDGLLGLSFNFNGSPRAAIEDLTADTMIEPPQGLAWMDSVNTDQPAISPDGIYFCLNSPDQSVANVYKKVGGEWSLVGTMPAGRKIFRGRSTTELISVGTQVQVYDVGVAPGSSGSFIPVRTFSYASLVGQSKLVQVSYDHHTQYIFLETVDSFYKSTIRTFDVVTFQQQEECFAYTPPAIDPVRHLYSNHYHFLTSGHIEKVTP